MSHDKVITKTLVNAPTMASVNSAENKSIEKGTRKKARSNNHQAIPLSLYIHIPWCVRKCPYCDFNSHVMKGNRTIAEVEDDYVNALLLDLQYDIERFEINRPIHSIFFGGGTPSLFSDKAISKILTGVNNQLNFIDNIEITLETNPGTAEISFIKGYQSAGVNRISLGIQSFQDEYLHKLGRIHDHKEAIKAIELVAKLGFSQWNIDLMYGLPEQSLSDAKKDISQILAFSPPHVSAYQMTIEPNTTFAVKPPKLPSTDTLEQIHDVYTDTLNEAGYNHYEVSAHGKTQDNLCQHNINYWQYGDYLGIGAGAHGKISTHSSNGISIVRTEKTPSPLMYMNAAKNLSFTRNKHTIEESDLLLEYGMNALRLASGFSFKDFENRTGLDKSNLQELIDKAQKYQWLDVDKSGVKPSLKGRWFLNNLLEILSEIH